MKMQQCTSLVNRNAYFHPMKELLAEKQFTSSSMLQCNPWAPVLPQASLQKSLDSQKNSLDLKKITRVKICVKLKWAILLEMI